MDTKLVTHRIENDICIIKILSSFVSPDIPELVKYLSPILNERTTRGLIINLGGNILVDSVFVGFLINTLKECQERKIKYGLCAVDSDFIGIFQNFQNVRSDQFLGIFETEEDALESFEERWNPSETSSNNVSPTQPRVVTNEIFYFVSPKTNWKFNRNQFIVLGCLLVGLFITILALSIYQHFSYQSLFTNLHQQEKKQRSVNQELQQNLKVFEQQHIVLKQQIDQKDFLLSLVQKDSSIDKEKEETLREKETEFLQTIADKQKELATKSTTLDELQSQFKQSLRRIRFLSNINEELEKQWQNRKKQIQETPTSIPPPTIPSVIIQPLRVIIDQFQMSPKEDSVSIQFNLKNISNEVQTGFILIHALQEEELGQEILFDTDKAMTFTIRRFRRFTQDFVQPQTHPYLAIALVVWDRSYQKLLEEHYPIE